MAEDGDEQDVDREQGAAQGRHIAEKITGENGHGDAEQIGAQAADKVGAKRKFGERKQVDFDRVGRSGDEVDEERDGKGLPGGGLRQSEIVAREPAQERQLKPATRGGVTEHEVKRERGREQQQRRAEAKAEAGGKGEHAQGEAEQGQHDEGDERGPAAESHRVRGEGAGFVAPDKGGEGDHGESQDREDGEAATAGRRGGD